MELESPGSDVREPPAPASVLGEGTAVLVRGPALSGKYKLLMSLLSTNSEYGLLVSTSRQGARAREDFSVYEDPDQLAVVDCASRIQGEEGADDQLLRYASSPENLTDIGVKFTALVETMQDWGGVTVGIHSLSELVMYWEPERVFQFVRIMLAECREQGWPMVATIDDTAVDEQTVSTLTQPFDTIILTRIADDGGQEFMVQQQEEPDTEWMRF
jgi:hypothetical protein